MKRACSSSLILTSSGRVSSGVGFEPVDLSSRSGGPKSELLTLTTFKYCSTSDSGSFDGSHKIVSSFSYAGTSSYR